ncbi:hypothetical protein KP509_09G063800 [Ceratopteris richardii]|uniref:Bifunctional inhibitor/plant lipid transfer protein/seed storage helical domain-containing protein n=1 Tax=Ceratopteris richardii TaxID=49495 RepID=A0A8T2U8P7_CERRI|nr:hypothetical protein KP509_1Z066100 [Ceratopteris richardii]KAH7429743.1 hypothetical protein KP509_09G063800 [Ceratopteris richardii]KAH7429744.1 hypothetical protein KP509_09G063800 [Ceratopteris richardii]
MASSKTALFFGSAFVVMLMMVITIPSDVDAACPSPQILFAACGQYVLGSNPPPPPYAGKCCNILRSSSASCICSSIPAYARSSISAKAVSNVRSSCRVSGSCPGF